MRVMILRKEAVWVVMFTVALSIVIIYKSLGMSANERYHVVHYVIEVPETSESKGPSIRQPDVTNQSLTNYKYFILSFGGMELTILLDNLNNFDDIIYWHEPMKLWQQINHRFRRIKLSIFYEDPLKNFVFKEKPNNISLEITTEEGDMYESSAAFYTELLSCKFSQRIEKYLVYAVNYCPELLLGSKSISELLGCTNDKQKISCVKTTDITTRLNQLCERRRSNVVVKERQEHIQNFEAIYSSLDRTLKKSLNVLQLVRDPRAVLFDITRHGLIARNIYRVDFQNQVHFVCERLSDDLTFGRKSLKRYHLRRYEDIARTFDKDIFRDVFQLKPALRTDDRNISNELRKRIPNYDSTTLDVNWWRREIAVEIASAMENLCWRSIQDLGYSFIGLEKILLRGNKTLIEENE